MGGGVIVGGEDAMRGRAHFPGGGAVPFVGAEAVRAGVLARRGLDHCTRVLQGVYVRDGRAVDAVSRAAAAWLWCGRRGVVGGWSAAAMLGAGWFVADQPAEVYRPGRQTGSACGRVAVASGTVREGEWGRVFGVPVTTPARTAFDLARREYPRGERDLAIKAVDAVLNVTRIPVADALGFCDRYPRKRGVGRAREVLALADAGADSPQETALRLVLVRAGIPGVRTQVPVWDSGGRLLFTADVAVEAARVALMYDRGHHLRREQRDYDVLARRRAEEGGWTVIWVVAAMISRPEGLVRQVRGLVEGATTRPIP